MIRWMTTVNVLIAVSVFLQGIKMKVTLVLSLVFLAVAAASPASRMKRVLRDPIVLYPELMELTPMPGPGADRIINGAEAEPHSHPSIVNLLIDDMYFCGGNLIAPNVVLTAAHCADGFTTIQITAGDHNLEQPENEVIITATGPEIIVHPEWARLSLNNDIALVVLGDASFPTDNSNIGYIELADAEPAVGELAQAAGWGVTTEGIVGGEVSPVLKEVTVPIQDESLLDTIFPPYMNFTTKICIDTAEGGVCSGDSGGPLVDLANGRLTGLTSFGFVGCFSGTPACFTSVPYYLDWIKDNSGVGY